MIYAFPRVRESGQEFTRYYLSPDLYLEERDGEGPLLSEREIDPGTAGLLKRESRLVVSGWREDHGRFEILHTKVPWACTLVCRAENIPTALLPFEGGVWEYFQSRSVGIFGAPGSGKTILARRLSDLFSTEMGLHSDAPYEYASTFIARHGIPKLESQLWIILEQARRESDIARTKQMMISDCPHPLGFLYLQDQLRNEHRGADKTAPWILSTCLEGLSTFDTCVYLPLNPDRCVDDGIRYHDPEQSQDLDRRIREFLEVYTVGYFTYEGDIQALARTILSLNTNWSVMEGFLHARGRAAHGVVN